MLLDAAVGASSPYECGRGPCYMEPKLKYNARSRLVTRPDSSGNPSVDSRLRIGPSINAAIVFVLLLVCDECRYSPRN